MNYKKIWASIFILCVFCFPLNVFALEIDCSVKNMNVSVCDSGCDYSDLGELFDDIDTYTDDCDLNSLTINIGEGYYPVSFNSIGYVDNLTIKGADKNKTTLGFDEHFRVTSTTNASISDLKINSNDEYYSFKVRNSKNVNLNNLIIDAKNSEVGILFEEVDNVKVNNTVINGANSFGVYNNRCEPNTVPSTEREIIYRNLVEINNSDISNNTCGVLDGCFEEVEPLYDSVVSSFESYASTSRSMIEYEYDTTVINNSKLGCAIAYGELYRNYPPSIYIKSNNTWTEIPVYDENIVELADGRVVVEFEEERSVSLKNKNQLEINSIFENSSEFDWVVEDETIAKVKDGKIIPLKVGKTILTATNGSINYRVNLVVTNDLLNNPKTLNIGYILVAVIVFGVFGSLIYKKQKSN